MNRFNYNSITKMLLLMFGLAATLVQLTACSGSIEDVASIQAKKDAANNNGEDGSDGDQDSDLNPTNPGDSPTAGNPGSEPGNGSGVGSGAGTGNGSGLPPAAPQVEILNINSSYLRGGITQNIIFRVTSPVGALSHIEYIVDCPTTSAVPENSITTGSAANSASAVTIQNNVVSVGAGEDTIVSWATPNLSDVRCIRTDGNFEQADNGFKIRVTSIGEANLSTSVESDIFEIDSVAPTFNSTGLACSSNGCIQGGLLSVEITGLSDLVTPIVEVCGKFDDTTAPTMSDLCWKSVSALGVTPALSPAFIFYTPFATYLPYSGSMYFWARDAAGNVTSLSNSNAGTVALDKLDINYAGTIKIASSDSSFLSSSDGLHHDLSSAVSLNFNTPARPGLTKYVQSDSNYENISADLNSISYDPAGFFWVKDATHGLVRIDSREIEGTTMNPVRSVVIPETGTFNEGVVGVDSPSFHNLKRHAIDSKGVHWFIDNGRLAYLDFNSDVRLTHVAGGGADDVSDDFTDPLLLKINSSDNIDAYGVFIVLPNQWVVFSADDPSLPLNPSVGNRFKLRVYKHSDVPSERRVSTIYLEGSTTQGATDNLVPYSNLAISFDPIRNNIASITGRFCEVSDDPMSALDNCDSAKLIQFSISTNADPVYLGSLAKDSFMSFQYLENNLYMMDVTKAAVYKYDSGYFQKLVGSTSRGGSYCQNMSVSTSCALRIVDFKIIPNGRDQVLLVDQNYLRIVEEGQIFTVYSTVP